MIHWRVIFLFKIHIKARFLLSGFPNDLFIFPTSFSYVAKPFKGTGKEFRKNLWNLLCCSEFCQLELSKRDFRSAVDRLNSNVLHLCFTQVGKKSLIRQFNAFELEKVKKKTVKPVDCYLSVVERILHSKITSGAVTRLRSWHFLLSSPLPDARECFAPSSVSQKSNGSLVIH